MKKTPFILFVLFIFILYFHPYDDTDDIINKERSGLSLYIDHLTGCQYLTAGILQIGLTPRLDKNYNQIGCNKEQ